MANAITVTRTNYFRVTDEEKYQEIWGKLEKLNPGLPGLVDFTKARDDGSFLHAFGCYGEIELSKPDGFDFVGELQGILPEDDMCIIMAITHEKLRYVTGYSILISRDGISHVDLLSETAHKSREILGPTYDTVLGY